jgi:hypothetical protein
MLVRADHALQYAAKEVVFVGILTTLRSSWDFFFV